MKISRNKALLIATILVLSLIAFAGVALAQGPGDNDGQQNWLGQMQEWMGPQAWDEMIQHMNQIHGPEFTDEMIQEMNQDGGCHGAEGFGDMMGGDYEDMMGGDYNGMMGGSYGTMMGSAM